MSAQTDSLRAAIAEIDATIAQRTAMLQQPQTPQSRRAIEESIASLQAQRSLLQAQLNDLEAADVEVQPAGDAPANDDGGQD
jgi:chromosome segregation ATPase